MVPFSVPRILLTIYLPSSWSFKQPAARARLSACKLTSGTVWRRSFNPDFATIVLAVLWECNSDIRQSGELKPNAEGSFERIGTCAGRRAGSAVCDRPGNGRRGQSWGASARKLGAFSSRRQL